MSGVVKKYTVVADGCDIQFGDFHDTPEEAIAKTDFDMTYTEEAYFVIEVTKTWEVKSTPRIVEEDNTLFFLGKNIPQSKPKTTRKVK